MLTLAHRGLSESCNADFLLLLLFFCVSVFQKNISCAHIFMVRHTIFCMRKCILMTCECYLFMSMDTGLAGHLQDIHFHATKQCLYKFLGFLIIRYGTFVFCIFYSPPFLIPFHSLREMLTQLMHKYKMSNARLQ